VSVAGVRRLAWAELSTSALTHNVGVLRSVVAPAKLCAVVKANGYGHGAVAVARAALAAGADSLAVALVDEGIELRAAGIDAPILLLGEIPADTVADALGASLTLTVGSLEGARAAVSVAENLGGRHRVHVKVDTGMHRLGAAPESVDALVDELRRSEAVEVEGLYTHFAVAEAKNAEDRDFTLAQLATFVDVAEKLRARDALPPVRHAANSAGALGFSEARLDMVRVGLALYGYLPAASLAQSLEPHQALRPVMSVRARVVATRRLTKGERPSYGRRRALSGDATVATVPFGYADGLPRRLFEAGAEVLLRGRRYPLAGTVTMDQVVVDVGDDEVRVGDEVVLLGRQGTQEITADEWSRLGGTISWEILCGIGARVPRVWVD